MAKRIFRRWRTTWCVVLGVVLTSCCLCVVSWAVAEKTAAFSRVVAAEVKGLVLYTDGVTPAERVPVRIWSVSKREFVYETETNRFGRYALPKLEPGEYFVTFDWTKVRLIVMPNGGATIQQPHDVIVVIPRSVGFLSIQHLSTVLIASTLTETARRYDDDRPHVVSP